MTAGREQDARETLRAAAQALVARWDDVATVEPCEGCARGGYVCLWQHQDDRDMDARVDDLRAALLPSPPATTGAGMLAEFDWARARADALPPEYLPVVVASPPATEGDMKEGDSWLVGTHSDEEESPSKGTRTVPPE